MLTAFEPSVKRSWLFVTRFVAISSVLNDETYKRPGTISQTCAHLVFAAKCIVFEALLRNGSDPIIQSLNPDRNTCYINLLEMIAFCRHLDTSYDNYTLYYGVNSEGTVDTNQILINGKSFLVTRLKTMASQLVHDCKQLFKVLGVDSSISLPEFTRIKDQVSIGLTLDENNVPWVLILERSRQSLG